MKPDRASLLLLQTNHDSSHYFADYLRTGNHPSLESADSLADRELLLAIKACEKFVIAWQSGGNSLEDLVSLLKNKLTFVFHDIGDEALVYTVFEVLNSRGLAVSWFDHLKSMLMAIVFEAETGNKSEIIDGASTLDGSLRMCRAALRLEHQIIALRCNSEEPKLLS